MLCFCRYGAEGTGNKGWVRVFPSVLGRFTCFNFVGQAAGS